MKFEIGDRVKITSSSSKFKGKFGTIIHLSEKWVGVSVDNFKYEEGSCGYTNYGYKSIKKSKNGEEIKEFKVGDRVIVNKICGLPIGMTGTVCHIANFQPSIGVNWDGLIGGHDCGGNCKFGKGYYVFTDNIKKIEEEKKGVMSVGKAKPEKKSFMEQTVERFEKKREVALNNVNGNELFEIKEIIHGNDNTTVVKFADGKIYKAKPVGDDVMDLQNAMGVIMAKKALQYFGLTYGMVTKYGLHMDKLFNEEAKAIQEVEDTQKRQVAKLAAKKKARDKRRREARIEEQKEAYVRAMKEVRGE